MDTALDRNDRAAAIAALERLPLADLKTILQEVVSTRNQRKDVERLVVEAEHHGSHGRLRTRVHDSEIAGFVVDLTGPDLLSHREVRYQLVRHAEWDIRQNLFEYRGETRTPRGTNHQATMIAQRTWKPGKPWPRFFVKQMGFPPVFAGLDGIPAAPDSEDVEPFVPLPPLADFQTDLRDQVKLVLQAPPGSNRAIMSLPTGAGKTRTVVEALVEWRLSQIPHPAILWIAQSDELCEQAVQAFKQVWVDQGARPGATWETLSMYRLWGGRRPELLAPSVIVASIQQLYRMVSDRASEEDRSSIESMGEIVGAIVIDEAHKMEAHMYREVLSPLGVDVDRAKQSTKPLIGLTATPYRSDTEETQRLVARFHRRLLRPSSLEPDPVATLRERKVLARPVHQVFDYKGTVISLDDNPKFRQYFEQFGDFHPELLEALGEEPARNRRLVDIISDLPESWPVLFFGCSVQHAEAIAMLLRRRGRTAATVTSDTRSSTRRFLIEEFRAKRISVLCNYGVLTTGFDAPQVRALIIARPTTSVVLYEQMIGRGMRGPAFGGTDECLVIDVQDNIRFGGQLAYTRYEEYWTSTDGRKRF